MGLDQHGNDLPDFILPARTVERNFTLADLNVLRDHGSMRVRALVAIIDALRADAVCPTCGAEWGPAFCPVCDNCD